MSRVLRVMIVAAFASLRAGLHALLRDTPDCEVVGEVQGSGDLERLLPELRPDLVVCDASDEEAQRVASVVDGEEVGLVLLSDSEAVPASFLRLSLHGWAFLSREADAEELAAAVRGAGAGLVALTPVLAARLLSSAGTTLSRYGEPGEALTVREREVLQLMARGLPNKQIAARLGISAHTAKFHVAGILAKLGATSRTEAVTIGARRGDVLL